MPCLCRKHSSSSPHEYPVLQHNTANNLNPHSAACLEAIIDVLIIPYIIKVQTTAAKLP